MNKAGNSPSICLPQERPWVSTSPSADDWSLQKLAPYIGRMKTTIARALVQKVTSPGDLLVDPFCGCGVIPYEAAVLGRRVLASDWNPYAIALTRAKLFAPRRFEDALHRLAHVWDYSRTELKRQDLRIVPLWVRRFFHKDTLRSALAFRDACHRLRDDFLLACLLGILHHQRPGFLSFPSSHLVPYLRDRKFPRHVFPELYKPREVLPRLIAKVARLYKVVPNVTFQERNVIKIDARLLSIPVDIQAVVTSPPYMNELDYVRDNRLRLWFIDRSLPEGLELGSRSREEDFSKLLRLTFSRIAERVRFGGSIVLVLGDVTRRVSATAPEFLARGVFKSTEELQDFKLVSRVHDFIPDVRRSRRECQGTRLETILIYQKSNGR